MSHTHTTKGFTLIELLVVVAIIGVLSSIVFSSISEIRQKAKITKVAIQLKEIEKGLIAALLEENRDRYWTGTELGAGGNATPRNITQMLNRNYPDPGWAISNYLNIGHATWPNGTNIAYRYYGGIANPCTGTFSNSNGVYINITTNNLSLQEMLLLQKIIDGEETDLTCGKIGHHSGGSHLYYLSRNASTVDF